MAREFSSDDDDDGSGNAPAAPHPSVADSERPPALRRAIADARQCVAAELELPDGALASPLDLLLHGAQAATDASGSACVASTNAAYAAGAAANPQSLRMLEDAAVKAGQALDSLHEGAAEIEHAANTWQAAIDDILAQIAELKAARQDAEKQAAADKRAAAQEDAAMASHLATAADDPTTNINDIVPGSRSVANGRPAPLRQERDAQ